MPNIPPQPKVDQITWFENHLPLWAATPTAFGTSAAAVTALTTVVKAARSAYSAAQSARDLSKAATTAETEAVATMLVPGRQIVNTMKSFIEASGNTALWGQSGLTPPAGPGVAPTPTAPYAMSATLDSEGNVLVKWKTSQPKGVSGVIYSVRRSIDGGAYTLLDSVGEKKYTDESVPVGTVSVAYVVQAKRGRQFSNPSESLTIRFGRSTGGQGLTIASVTNGPSKLAA